MRNKFHQYKSLHDRVYNQLLEAITKEAIDYWSYQYNRLWRNCWEMSNDS